MEFDVLIVGSGAGGGMTALRLCELGFKVGLIERGPRFDPRKDYVQNYADWETRDDPLDKARSEELTINRGYRTPYTRNNKEALRRPFIYHRVHGVGGSTLHYQGEAHRFGEHTFNIKSQFGVGLDWPINYADLKPYYEQAEKLLGVAGKVGNPFKPDREAFPTAAHALSPRSVLLAESAKKAGFTVQANTLALPSQSIDGRTPCQHSGGCNFGCVFGAKSSVDQAIIPRAEKTGNLKLFTETRALKLSLDKSGEIRGLECQNTQQALTLSAKAYVLAGGALETPRLMLHSPNNELNHSYANQHDQVGRYFMETVMSFTHPKVELDFQTHRGPPLDSRVWDFYYPINAKTSGFVLGSAGFLHPGIGPSRFAEKVNGIGRAHKQKVRDQFGRDLYMFGITEQEPVATNRVFLSDKNDDDGVPKLNIHNVYSQQDHHTLDVMRDKLRAWVDATPGLQHRYTSTTRNRSSATHVAGTCRMGDDPLMSVVDRFGKVHGQSNCYISDGSVMPTQGAGDSPSLTIQALALRTADKIADDLRNA